MIFNEKTYNINLFTNHIENGKLRPFNDKKGVLIIKKDQDIWTVETVLNYLKNLKINPIIVQLHHQMKYLL